jgi:hypothetical protein
LYDVVDLFSEVASLNEVPFGAVVLPASGVEFVDSVTVGVPTSLVTFLSCVPPPNLRQPVAAPTEVVADATRNFLRFIRMKV